MKDLFEELDKYREDFETAAQVTIDEIKKSEEKKDSKTEDA